MTTKELEAKGTVWHSDEDHPLGNGGYEVVAKALVRWADEDELVLDISREDGEIGESLYMSPDQAKDLLLVIAAALADSP